MLDKTNQLPNLLSYGDSYGEDLKIQVWKTTSNKCQMLLPNLKVKFKDLRLKFGENQTKPNKTKPISKAHT